MNSPAASLVGSGGRPHPTYRAVQDQIYARQGITLDRSTLADWVGRTAFALRPVHAWLLEQLK
jgi:transposase